MNKNEIKIVERTDADYTELIKDIRKKGKIISIKPIDLSHQKILSNNIDNFIEKNKGLKNSDFLLGFLKKLKEIVVEEIPEDKKQFALDKHWEKLNLQINQEIDSLINHLNVIKKDSEMKNKLFKLGDYNKIFQEDDLMLINSVARNKQNKKVKLNKSPKLANKSQQAKYYTKDDEDEDGKSESEYESENESESEDINLEDNIEAEIFKEANKKRHMRIEKNIKHYLFNFFRSSLAIVKNNAFDKYQNFEMNSQWKYLIYYREHKDLFTKVYNLFDSMTQDLDLFIGTNNKYFTYQNASLFFRCIFLILINQMIEFKYEKKKSKRENEAIRADQDDLDLSDNMDVNFEKSELELQNFNMKNFSEQKVIILYVSQIIERIVKEERDFNELTQSYMTIISNRKQEERVRKNLNLIAILAQDGRKDLRKAILEQKRLGLIDYEDFQDILAEEIDAGNDNVAPFDRDMELLDELNDNEDIQGHVVEEKRKQKLLEYDEADEDSYVPGEEDDYDDF
jgi:hypothetical protein